MVAARGGGTAGGLGAAGAQDLGSELGVSLSGHPQEVDGGIAPEIQSEGRWGVVREWALQVWTFRGADAQRCELRPAHRNAPKTKHAIAPK